MELPEVYIPSIYNALQQGRADKRTARLNALQDQLVISQKQMADEQRKAQLAFNIADYIEKQKDDADKATLYAEAIPQLAKLFPDMQLPPTYSKQAVLSIKAKTKPYIPTEYKSAGDVLYRIEGTDVTPVGGTQKSDFTAVTQTFQGKDGAVYAKEVPKYSDMFGNIHVGPNVLVRGYPEPVTLKDYEAYLQANMPPEQFQQYKSTRVNIPVSQAEQSDSMRVPNYLPQGTPSRQAPSPQNTAGSTNQGFPISEDEVPQQGAPKPLRFEDLVNPDGSIRVPQRQAPTIDYGSEPPPVAMQPPSAPQGQPTPVMGVNALMGDSTMPEGVNRFAMLAPYGSEPNRFGSPAVEGMEQAYVGTARQVGRPPQPNQPNKVTKEDLMIKASQGDQQALAQIKRMNEIEQSIKGQKVSDKVFKDYQQLKTDMKGVRDTLLLMRQARVQLANKKINLSPMSQASNVPLTFFDLQSGVQDNTDTFKSNMQAQANALLLENKGVQTDGDAKRAMTQLAQPLAYVNNSKMINALDNGISSMQRLYNRQLSSLADYNKQYPAIGGQ